MRAAVMVAHNEDLVIEELEAGPIGPHDVEVEIEASGVCGSDLTVMNGLQPPPSVIGHEGAGKVTAIGSEVTRVKVGDRVIGAFNPVCGDCWFCRNDLTQHCTRSYKISMETRLQRPDGTPVWSMCGLGTWAEIMRSHEASLVPVRSDLPGEQLALIGCGVTTGVGAALNTAEVKPGSVVVVIGAGGVGQFVIQGARIAGAAAIVAVDPSGLKREAALGAGATHAVDPTTDDVNDVVRSLTARRGADYAFEVVGRPELVRQAFDLTRTGGTTVIVGMAALDAEVNLPLFDWFMGEKRVLGCKYGSSRVRRDFDRLVALTEAGKLDVESAVTRVWDLADINEAIAALRAGEVVRGVVRP